MIYVVLVLGFQKRANRSTCTFTNNHQIEMDLIKNMLYLSDLNSGNFGLDEKQQLAIVDFGVISIFLSYS